MQGGTAPQSSSAYLFSSTKKSETGAALRNRTVFTKSQLQLVAWQHCPSASTSCPGSALTRAELPAACQSSVQEANTFPQEIKGN